MAGAFIGATAGGGNASNYAATSAILDTTGANLLVAAVGYLNAAGDITAAEMSDSKGNAWTALNNYVPASGRNTNSALRMFYCQNPSSVGAGHTATVDTGPTTGAVIVPAIAFAAFRGALTSGVLNAQTGSAPITAVQLNAIQPGSLTPSVDDCIFVAAASTGDSRSGMAVDSSFTLGAGIAGLPGQCFGVELAYFIQTTAAAKNPQLSGTGPDFRSASIAAFSTGGGGGGGGSTRPIRLSGGVGGFAGDSGGFA